MSSHCGTHVDAPLHSGSRILGLLARTITDIPLEELYRPGLVLDVRPWAKPNEEITTEMLDAALAATGKTIQQGDAVLIRELTGLRFTEFADRLGDMQTDPDAGPDQDVLLAMVGCAVWHRNPRWSRERAVRFAERINMADFTPVEGDDADPPSDPAASPSTDSSAGSTSSPAPSPEQDQS